MNILPGEPLPPGSEDEITQIPVIQQSIDLYKGNALVGLEYTIELHEDNRDISYLCVICDKRSDSRTVMQHWTSYNHRLKYLEKHYPTAVRELNKVRQKPDGPSIMVNIVQSLAEAIEDHHGRLAPLTFSADDFRRTKSKTLHDIYTKFHFDENAGPNFVSVVERTLWESQPPTSSVTAKPSLQVTLKAGARRTVNDSVPTTRDGLDEVSSDSDNGADNSKRSKKKEQSPAYRLVPQQPAVAEGERPGLKNLPTPKELSMQASLIAQERYKWEKYRCMLEIQIKQMVASQTEWERNPEKHPLYPEEWKKFWNRRYKELQLEKKVDPNKYDYKPEWIAFWNTRVKELFNLEVEQKKKEIKLSLNLPEDAEERIDQLKEKYKVGPNRGPLKVPAETAPTHRSGAHDSHKGDVIDISDEEPSDIGRRRRRKSRSYSSTRRRSTRSPSPRKNSDYRRNRRRESSPSLSPLSDDYDRGYSVPQRKSRHGAPGTGAPYYEPHPMYMRSRYAAASPPPVAPRYVMPSGYRPKDPYATIPRYEPPAAASAPSKPIEEEEPEDDSPLTVVAVLRLLTALEDQLGSLGPKVVDLLGKALALEKIKANSADELLMNEDNCVFFETAKEKLKGLLIAEVIEDAQKIRAVKKAIKNIAATMHQVSVKGVNKEKNSEVDSTELASTASSSATNRSNSKTKNRLPRAQTDLPFDRQVIASKLAAALVKEGREDVSVDDMDKLIYIFILMAKLSKEKVEIDGKPLQVNEIVRAVGIPVVTNVSVASPTVVAPIVKAILPTVLPTILPSALPAMVDEFLESASVPVPSFSNRNTDSNDASNDTLEKDMNKNNDSGGGSLESLTDSDLQTLLQNFKHLSSEEQEHLIRHLKKLELAEPSRYKKLRKFINMADLDDASYKLLNNEARHDDDSATTSKRSNRFGNDDSPLAKRDRRGENDKEHTKMSGANISNPNPFSLDDEDDDDYNFDDVLKAATSNVDSNSRHSRSTRNASITPERNTTTANRSNANFSVTDTENLIENIMVSLNQKNKPTAPNVANNMNQQMPAVAASASTQPAVHGMASQPIQTFQHQSVAFPQQQQQQQQRNYPQQQPAGYPQQAYPQQGYNQMGQWNNAAAGYYNNNGMTNPQNFNNTNNAVAYAAYPNQAQWNGNAQQMQQYPGYMHPQQQQQQQQQQQMGYNMYGGN